MTKKAIAEETLVKLIAFVFVIAIVLIIFFNINTLLKGETNKETISNWVKARGVFKGVVTAVPPVSDLQEPLEIKDEGDLLSHGNEPPRAFKEIANSMTDCWGAFDRGQTDFLNNIHRDVFCFPCRAIVFSDEIKRNQAKMIGFNRYLNDTRTKGKDSSTYLQFLANDNNLMFGPQDLADDKIVADKNLYVYFFAASGRGLTNIITNVIGLGDVVPEATQQSRAYNPTNVAQPQTNYSGLSGSEKAELAGVGTGGLVAGRYVLPRVAESLSSEATALATTSTTTTQTAEQLLFRRAVLEVSETGAQKITLEVAARATETAVTREVVKEVAEKAAERTFAKFLAKAGAKVVSGPIGWAVTIGTAGYGIYQVIWGEKPFVAKVMIVEPDKVYSLCNA